MSVMTMNVIYECPDCGIRYLIGSGIVPHTPVVKRICEKCLASPTHYRANPFDPGNDEVYTTHDLALEAYQAGERADPDLIALGDRYHAALADIGQMVDEVNRTPPEVSGRLVVEYVRSIDRALHVDAVAA